MGSVVKGQIGEAGAVALLLEAGFQVYQSTVDIHGIDLVIAPEGRTSPEGRPFRSIQVKSARTLGQPFRIPRRRPAADYYLLLVEDTSAFWLVPKESHPYLVKDSTTKATIKDHLVRLGADSFPEFRGFQRLFKDVAEPVFQFHAARTGTIGEKLGIGFLLGQGLDVYESLADDKGIDAIVAVNERFMEIQIKYSSRGYSFRNVRKRPPSAVYWFLLVRGQPREYFLVPSEVVESSQSGSFFLNAEHRRRYRGTDALRRAAGAGF